MEDLTKVQLARQVLTLSGAHANMVTAFQLQLNSMSPLIGDVPEELNNLMDSKNSESLLDSMAALFADKYTNEELFSMRDFYGSEVGQSIQEKGPDVIAASHKLGEDWGRKLVQDLL